MKDEMFIPGVLSTFVFVFLMVMAYSLGGWVKKDSIVEACDKQGTFIFFDKIYECKQREAIKRKE